MTAIQANAAAATLLSKNSDDEAPERRFHGAVRAHPPGRRGGFPRRRSRAVLLQPDPRVEEGIEDIDRQVDQTTNSITMIIR